MTVIVNNDRTLSFNEILNKDKFYAYNVETLKVNIGTLMSELCKDNAKLISEHFEEFDYVFDIKLLSSYTTPTLSKVLPESKNNSIEYSVCEFVYKHLNATAGYIQLLLDISPEYCVHFIRNVKSNFESYYSLQQHFKSKMHNLTNNTDYITDEEIETLKRINENVFKLLNINIGQKLVFDVPELKVSYISLDDIVNGKYKLKNEE